MVVGSVRRFFQNEALHGYEEKGVNYFRGVSRRLLCAKENLGMFYRGPDGGGWGDFGTWRRGGADGRGKGHGELAFTGKGRGI